MLMRPHSLVQELAPSHGSPVKPAGSSARSGVRDARMSLERTVLVSERINDKGKGGAIYQGVSGMDEKVTTLEAVSKSTYIII